MSSNTLRKCLKCSSALKDEGKPLECTDYCERGTADQQKILEAMPNVALQCESCLEQRQSQQKLSQQLEQCLREHEKRLQLLEEGLERSSKLDPSCQKAPTLCPFLPHTIGRKAIVITAVIVGLIILLAVILALTPGIFGKTLKTMNLEVISVSDWGGRQPKRELAKLNLPVERVIISHTAAEGCESRDVCEARVRVVQSFHMDGWNWDHIGYNFLIGGDGLVYEGRGWDYQGAHTLGYNVNSIGISFIGTYIKIHPTEQQLRACQLLIAEGVRLKKLVPDYRLYGHRQLSATESPGEILYGIIQKWPHWTHTV